jgi:hypothetical protein
MSILQQISVGNTFYYEVDDIPTHTAPKGSVSVDGVTGLIYQNNNGGSVWLKNVHPNYGEMHVTGNVTGRDTAQNAWNNLNALTWVAGEVLGFSLQNGAELRCDTGSVLIVYLRLSGTVESDDKWMDYEMVTAINNTVQPFYLGGTGQSVGGHVSIKSCGILELKDGDYLNVGLRWTAREAGGGAATRTYIPKHCNYEVIALDKSVPTFLEGWEGGTFGSWSVVNDTTNQWVVGTAEAKSGSESAYVSNDGGTTAAYTNTLAEVSHFYMDFDIPSGYNKVYLTFDWKGWAENAAGITQYDYGTVVMEATSFTPVAGTEAATAVAVGSGNGRVGATTNDGKFNEGYGGSDNNWRFEAIDISAYAGNTKRVIFTFKCDTTAGDNPPFVVDNIKIEVI